MNVGIDNRLFERVDAALGVRYSPRGSDREFCSATKNISGGGIRMNLLKKLNPGTIVDLELFKYNTDIRAKCRGRIVWVWNDPVDGENKQSFEAGIQFIDTKFLSVGSLISCLKGQNKDNIL